MCILRTIEHIKEIRECFSKWEDKIECGELFDLCNIRDQTRAQSDEMWELFCQIDAINDKAIKKIEKLLFKKEGKQ